MNFDIPDDCDVARIRSDYGIHADKLFFIIHTLCWRKAFAIQNKSDEKEWFSFSSKRLHKFCGGSKKDSVLRGLVEYGYIEIDHNYIPNVRGKRYKLLLSGKGIYPKIICKDQIINTKKEQEDKMRQVWDKAKKATSIDDWHQVSIYDVGLRYHPDFIIKPCISSDEWYKQILNHAYLTKLIAGGGDYTIDDNGRRHTILTNLSKIIRNDLFFKSEPEKKLVVIDISNCQPWLLGVRMLGYIKTRPVALSGAGGLNVTQDVEDYLSVVQNGIFYEEMMKIMNIDVNNSLEREKIKEECYAQIFYGPISKKIKPLSLAFSTRWPTVWDYIIKSKGKPATGDFRQFSCGMMKEESDFIFSRVLPYIRKAHPEYRCFTIHDSIVTTLDRKDFVEGCFRQAAMDIGVGVNLKVTKLIPTIGG